MYLTYLSKHNDTLFINRTPSRQMQAWSGRAKKVVDRIKLGPGVYSVKKKQQAGTSLVIRWLGLRTSTAQGMGSIPGRGTKIPHAKCSVAKKLKKKKKEKKRNNRPQMVLLVLSSYHQTMA